MKQKSKGFGTNCNMAKLLVITHQLSRTGAPLVLLDMIKILSENGHSFSIISMSDGDLRAEFERYGSVEIRERFFDKKEEFRIEASNYDVVICNTLITYEAVLSLLGEKTPVLWWLHESERYFDYFSTVLPDFSKLKNTNIHVRAVSPLVSDIIERKYKVREPILSIAVKDVPAMKSKTEGKIDFLCVGTYGRIKGQDVLCEAIRKLPVDVMQKSKFYFVGNEQVADTEVLDKVLSLAATFDNVEKLAPMSRDRMLELMDESDVLLVPSRIDPLPTVVAEMLMKEKMVVLTDQCGVSKYIENHVDAEVIPAEDIDSFCDVIRIIVNKELEINSIGKTGRRVYEKYFKEESIALLYNKTIEEMTIEGKHRKEEAKLICMTGVYDIIDIFTYQMMDKFQELGYEVMEFNTKRMTENLGKLYDFIKTPVKAVLTFNNLGFNMELIEGKNLWETLNIPVINILLDHPFCHKNALDNAPSNSIILTIDKNHMNYVSRFYPNIPMVGFLPLAGKHLEREKKPLSERSIDVIYAGGISRSFAEKMKPDWSKYDFDAEKLCEDALEILIKEPSHTTEEVIEEQLKKTGVRTTDPELCQLIEDFHFVDLLAVSYYREKVVRTLVENGVRVTLFGTGWECCDWLDNPNLDFRGRVSADEIVEIMHDSKIVLSTMTWFKDGAHDRVFNGMLSGAVAVTDSSKYMKEEFISSTPIDEIKDELVMFELEEVDALPGKIRFLLNHLDKAQLIANRGYKKAFEHTWASRAEELDRDLLSQI